MARDTGGLLDTNERTAASFGLTESPGLMKAQANVLPVAVAKEETLAMLDGCHWHTANACRRHQGKAARKPGGILRDPLFP